jgi:hypothetical protein
MDGDGLKLESGCSLYASTQTANSFNIFVEGLDCEYPNPLPDVCCNFYQENGSTGVVVASVANSSLNGNGTIADLYVAQAQGTNGAFVKSIIIKALQSTNEGMIRLFVGDLPANYKLMKDIYIPATNQGGFNTSFKAVIDLNFCLKAGYYIGVSTQNAESFAVTAEAIVWYYGV